MQDTKRASVEGRPLVSRVGTGIEVKSVAPGGLSDTMGIRPGDVLEAINGEPLRDPIDYRFHVGDELVEIHVRREGGEAVVLDIEKEPDEDLGLELEDMPILR